MQELRLAGVQDNGDYLVLNGTGDQVFRLRIDEALRAATSRQLASTLRPSAQAPDLSPREIQSKLRAGQNAEDIAREFGADLKHIKKYEGPVLAERQHIAGRARDTVLGSFAPRHESYWKAFGDDPVTLGELIDHELAHQGINPDGADWDAWRMEDGSWTVQLTFAVRADEDPSGESQPHHRMQTAQWKYDTATRTLTPLDALADDLSAMETDALSPRRQNEQVFDFEDSVPVQPQEAEKLPTGSDLLEVLRNRRGQRLGLDEDTDEALATLLAHPALPHQSDGPHVSGEPLAWNPLPATGHQNSPGLNGASTARTNHPASGQDARSTIAQKYPNLFVQPPSGQEPGDGPDKDKGDKGPDVSAKVVKFEDLKARQDRNHPPAVTGTIHIPTGSLPQVGTPGRAANEDLATRLPRDMGTPVDTGPNPAAPRRDGQGSLDPAFRKPEAPEGADGGRPAVSTDDNGGKNRKKRSKVPSWDDIVFGPK